MAFVTTLSLYKGNSLIWITFFCFATNTKDMKYNEDIVKEICGYIRDGSNQKDAFKKAGISETTFYEWKRNNPQFSTAIKKAYDECLAEMPQRLETSLFKRALGYEVDEYETELGSDKSGKPFIKKKVTKHKHILPDTAALIFALSNLCPDKWKNRQNIEARADVKADVNDTHNYSLDAIPKEKLYELADMLQDAEKKNNDERKTDAEKETGEK